MTPLRKLERIMRMDDLRIKEENIDLGLFCSEFSGGNSNRRKISQVEFKEMNIVLAGDLFQFRNCGLGFLFTASTEIHFCIVFEKRLTCFPTYAGITPCHNGHLYSSVN